jgi:hypothetical protein
LDETLALRFAGKLSCNRSRPAGCWPRASERGSPQAVAPLIALSALAAAYLVFVGLSGASGVLLWPAAAVHLVLAILLARALIA